MNEQHECPYCLTNINGEDEVVTCQSCSALLHKECWAENGGCCVKDCSSAVRTIDIDIAPEEHKMLVLSRESVESAQPYRRSASIKNPCVKCGKQVAEGELYCIDCTPESEDSPDITNLWPILVMLALVVVTVIWIMSLTSSPFKSTPENKQPNITQGTGK